MFDINDVSKISTESKRDLLMLIKAFPDNYSQIIKARNKILYEKINLMPGIKFNQKIFNFIYDIHNVPLCHHCKKKEISWRNKFALGYSNYCSISCLNKSDEHKEKIKQTNLSRCGVLNGHSKEVLELIRQTSITKYGVPSYFQSEEFKETFKETMLNKYGVEHFMKNSTIAERILNSYKTKKLTIGGIDIKYQGFEDVVLKLVEFDIQNIVFGVSNVPKIEYYCTATNKNRTFYPDFYFKKINVIADVKSDWTMKRYLTKNIDKFKSTINLGFDFVFIICSSAKIEKLIGTLKGIESLMKEYNLNVDYEIIS